MSTNTPIASQTLTSAASSVTFSSIPQGYTDLVLTITGNNNQGTAYENTFTFNNDSSSSYSMTRVMGNGSTAYSQRSTSVTNGFAGWTNNQTSQMVLSINQIQNYSNSTTYKTWLSKGGDSTDRVYASVGLWRNTAAITSIKIQVEAGTYDAGSIFSIYGIQAGNKDQKATGGNIVTTDGTYMYHAFTSSGSFIPSAGLTADVLVVAGGGAGVGAGGGAGGVIAFASESLTAQSYTCIVGAGGTKATTSAAQATNGVNSQFGSLTAAVGGGKGGYGPTQLGSTGGSGGGAMADGGSALTGSAGTSGQGNSGGNGLASTLGGGGGGGAGAAGSNNSGTSGGAGGAGTNSVTNWGALSAVLTSTGLGVSGYIAGGGGGCTSQNPGSPGAGGSGGGGAGAYGPGSAGSGTVNTGSGGGGIYQNYPSAAGGSGLVIIRYLL